MPRKKKANVSALAARLVPGEDTTVDLQVGKWYWDEENELRVFDVADSYTLSIVSARELEETVAPAIGESLTAAHSLANAGEVPPLSEVSQSPEDAEAAAVEAAEGAQPAEPEPEEDE